MPNTSLDQQLLVDLKAGHPEAVRAWYTKYSPKLRAFFVRKVSVSADVDELVQDTFLSCMRHLPLFRGESSIWTWMQRIAQHEVADYYRRRYAKRVLRTFVASETDELPQLEDSEELSDVVRRVLLKMSAFSRELLQRKYVDKEQVKELARAHGRSPKAIESLLFRARAEFRELYAKE